MAYSMTTSVARNPTPIRHSRIAGPKRTPGDFFVTLKTATPGLQLHKPGARFYSCTLHTWLSRDPIGWRKVHLFQYVSGEPTARIDPLGLTDEQVPLTPELLLNATKASVIKKKIPLWHAQCSWLYGYSASDWVYAVTKTVKLTQPISRKDMLQLTMEAVDPATKKTKEDVTLYSKTKALLAHVSYEGYYHWQCCCAEPEWELEPPEKEWLTEDFNSKSPWHVTVNEEDYEKAKMEIDPQIQTQTKLWQDKYGPNILIRVGMISETRVPAWSPMKEYAIPVRDERSAK